MAYRSTTPFLQYKKELTVYGYEAGKISMKARTVLLIRKNSDD